ncbi:hypothetical protein V6N12_034915 [Hibiscus sabdariffa]|uniref:DUF4220 domain-containing protein n=1 Tax=Hibiscus sabdariffa TaxID=183260 RepID=A0ABR2BNU4_9ROSI
MRKRRGAMELVTPKLMKMWKDWKVRSMVLTSLLVQIILIVLGGRRKYIRRAKLRTIVWCSYLLADSVATIALGILTNNLGDIYNKRDYPYLAQAIFNHPEKFRDTKAENKRFFKERLTLSRIKEENRIRCNKTLLQASDSEFEEQEEENKTNTSTGMD